MSIASLLVILVSQVFLAQNAFYSHAIGRSFADDAVRTTSEFLGADLRGGIVGGVVKASARAFTFRSAIAVGGVCNVGVTWIRAFVPGIHDADTTEVAGYATRDAADDWTFTASTWGTLYNGPWGAAACAEEGVDTTGAIDDFIRFNLLSGFSLGDLVMLYKETSYAIGRSTLDPGFLALYRGESGGIPVELATGLMSASQFEYLVGSTWYTAPSEAQFDSISEVRVTVEATGQGDSTATTGYSSTMSIRVPLQGGLE